MSGKLFIISTPIGNLKDMSLRAKESLACVDLILAEDTRVSIKLLHHLGIKTPMVSCHDFNEAKRVSCLVEASEQDKSLALVCDAGTPLVSDPGYQIVRRAIELGLTLIPIPGPSALLAALVASGLPCDRFSFEGFLPDKKGERAARLESLAADQRTLVFYMAPSKLATVLSDIEEHLGPRKACLARELTKLHEEFLRGPLSYIKSVVDTRELKGEFVLVVEGAISTERPRLSAQDAGQKLKEMLDQGARLKDAASILTKETGWTSSQLYKLGLSLKSGENP